MLFILSDEEGGSLPGRQMHRETLNKLRQLHFSRFRTVDRPRKRAEGIDYHDRRVELLNMIYDALQYPGKITFHSLLTQVEKMDRLTHLVFIEEGKLLLVTQHLECGFTE